MKIASHNTMSYLPVKQWWLKPFAWMARCQSKDILKQHNAGCEIFDLRIKPVNKNGRLKWVFGHGLITYKHAHIREFLEALNRHAFCNGYDERGFYLYTRIILECSKRHYVAELFFKDLCAKIESEYPYIKWCGGQTKADWSTIYEFRNKMPEIKEHYASMPANPKLYGIFPWLYAKLTNTKALLNHKNDIPLMMDFI